MSSTVDTIKDKAQNVASQAQNTFLSNDPDHDKKQVKNTTEADRKAFAHNAISELADKRADDLQKRIDSGEVDKDKDGPADEWKH